MIDMTLVLWLFHFRPRVPMDRPVDPEVGVTTSTMTGW